MTDTRHPNPNEKLTIAIPAFLEKVIRRIPRSATRAALLFFASGAGLGLMIAATFEAASWYRDRPLPLRDLGSVDFSAVGLRGKLITKWDEKAEYRVRFEPIDKGQIDRFTLMVKEPPHPLKIKIYLSDSSGFTLCSKEIVLRFDFYKDLRDPQQSMSNPTGYVIAHEDALENERNWETDRDLFHSDITNDGKVGAISSQGEIPCSNKTYKRAIHWGFSSNFLTTAEQDDLLKGHTKSTEENGSSPSKHDTARGLNEKTGAPHSSFEGYDVISGYSIPGNIETSRGLTFYVYKEGERDNAIIWHVNSARIHYQCDENSMCTLTRAGTAVVLHAKLQQ
ncbi:hypothetical protein [Terracidiphilus sp.]|uniref:hypothetical protein n=1 Tax=Terracidiphilus sp. TaxID=1964191 RepID=UPI003C165B28